jgi:hypothetical protein
MNDQLQSEAKILKEAEKKRPAVQQHGRCQSALE